MVILARARLPICGHISLLVAVEPVNGQHDCECLHLLAGVAFSLDLGDIGRRDFPPVQFVPINLSKPSVGENIGRSSTQVTVSLSEVPDQEVPQEFFGESIEVRGIPDLACYDLSR